MDSSLVMPGTGGETRMPACEGTAQGTARAGVSQEFLEAKRVTPGVEIAKYIDIDNLNSRTWVFPVRYGPRFDCSKQVSGCDRSRCRFFFLHHQGLPSVLPRSVKGETSPHHQSGDARGAGGGHAAPVPEYGPPSGRGHKEGHGDSMVRPPSNGTANGDRNVDFSFLVVPTTNVVASAERRTRAFAPVRDSEPHASTSARALSLLVKNAGAPTPSAWPR